MDYGITFTLFFSGILLMWGISLREKIQVYEKEKIQREQKLQELLFELENSKNNFNNLEKEYIALAKDHESVSSSFEGIQKYILETKEQLVDKMKMLSHDVLTSTQMHFLNSAKAHFDESQKRFISDCLQRDERFHAVVTPLKTSLDEVKKKVVDFEMQRKESQGVLLDQIATLSKETAFLIKALRHPGERGKWGEVQLQRLVEMAGLMNRCDFSLQETSTDGSLRADMIVTLPNNRKIIIDSKMPLDGYIRAIESVDQEKYQKEIENHVEHLEKHIKTLFDKKYWAKYQGSIDFTVLFLPSEAILAAAIEKRPTLLEKALEKNILLATPSTMMALLHAVKLGWKESQVHSDLHDIVTLAREWVVRSSLFVDHFQKLGKSLGQTVQSFNAAVNSYESRFLVTMRKIANEERVGIGVQGNSIAEIDPVSLAIAMPESKTP